METMTFIKPRSECRANVTSLDSTLICTGHTTRAPTEYVFEVGASFNNIITSEASEAEKPNI